MSKQYDEDTILFSKDKITIYLAKTTYDAIEKIAKTKYKDARSIRGVVETYAVIQLYSRLGYTNKFVPIHREIFQYISKRNYVDYRELLREHNIIEYQKSELTQYKDIKSQNRISSTPTLYRISGIFGYLWSDYKTIPIHIKMSADYVTALKIKHKHIGEAYMFMQDKSKSIMEVNPNEIIVIKHISELVRGIIANKISTKRTYDPKVEVIDRYNKRISPNESLEPIIKRLLSIISNKHIVENKLLHSITNQSLVQSNANNSQFGYYKELQVDISALDECLLKSDLAHLSRINTIPNFGNADKIYSALANIRKPIRKYVTFRGAKLIEASDISCAHFTMLPVIFKRYNISIPSTELHKWIELTQNGDLYGAVVEGSTITRNDIKATFQPFLSIKNKNQFLYGLDSDELRKRETICEYFEANFPAIFNALLSWHTIADVSIKSVANQVESDIINPICDRLIEDGLHPFRIHDAIYLPENELPNLSFNIKEEAIKRINSEIW